MSLYQLQRERVKDSILEISIRIFREKGYENATIDEITKAVGIAKGTFYNFFTSKNEILSAWAEKRFQAIPFGEACNPEKTSEENLYQFIDILVDAMKDDTQMFRSFLKEIIRFQGDSKYKGQFDFITLYKMIINSSSDAESLIACLPEVKIDVLNHSLFIGVLNWFDRNNDITGLDEYLKNVVYVCMNGIKNVIDKESIIKRRGHGS